ncbi:hypothetical protein OO007_02495 [Cocleimonas sp. KMM 6892]|jgi:hypothetical protein|uniref:hypothetical protein n=1 Tax=unclassified Cocleimonas TaxID=2639732 RepID=UPI002DBBF9BC|nr:MULTISPECIES: hypothetical protein [unclassified Cocleimonas]MEB8431080.1 hypothetical protein [Cocleimonas sp. KMM 6892]MEC4714148.1 hypothetical protein [Cocleimonas sp. KMM 6895]MEC4743479.1 hypothetical protein [Cocleimonas sp. KMM 6896]
MSDKNMQNTIIRKAHFTKSAATLISRTLAITFLALFLQACELDDGTDSYDDDVTIVYSTDDGTDTLDNDDVYELLLRADGAYLILEDNLSTITIQGDGNYLVIDSDTSIDEISITGDDNIITTEDDVDLTIDLLNIIGNGNSVTAFEITTYNQTSDADDSENLACEVSDNGFCL